MIFHSHANKTHFHKKGCALSLILKVRVFGTRKWPILMQQPAKYARALGRERASNRARLIFATSLLSESLAQANLYYDFSTIRRLLQLSQCARR